MQLRLQQCTCACPESAAPLQCTATDAVKPPGALAQHMTNAYGSMLTAKWCAFLSWGFVQTYSQLNS